MPRQERKEDARIYIVIGLFFSCVISGGTFLGLYIFLPPNDIKHWYPTAGMILIGIPWAFWFLTYIYRCVRPGDKQCQPQEAFASPPATHMEAATISSMNSPPADESPVKSPDGARHVRFGEVVVIRNDSNKTDGVLDAHQVAEGHSEVDLEGGENSVNSRESEIPLTHFTSSS